jgi:zinc transport system substrate-binding protein
VKNQKIFMLVLFSILLVTLFAGCNQAAEEPVTEEGEKLLIITTLFPQYDFVKQIAGDKVIVTFLLPPGMEPHSFEPSPRDIADIQKADLFIYTGAYMEPWAERIIDAAEGKTLLIVDTSIGIDLMDEVDHHHHDEDEDHHEHGGKDPHFWLDPLLAKVMVDHIVEGLIHVDPDHEGYYRDNGETYKQQLQDLHDKIGSSLAGLENRTILYAGHFAFGYFAARYDLDHISPYEGFAPDAEPTPGNIAELIKRVNESNAKVIFYEELIEPKVAKVVAEQTGAEMVLLHGAHNVTTDELNSGITYIQIMEDNLAKLLEGLQ